MIVLGISALYHDSAAAIVVDGEIIAAAQEERFTRKKHDNSIPCNAIEYCLKATGIDGRQVDMVVYYDNPILTLDRFVKNVKWSGTDSKDLIEYSFDSLFKEKIWIHKYIENVLGKSQNRKIYVCQHHISHAASAFYPSPYEKAVIISIDGVGEWATTSIGIGSGNSIELKEIIKYPHSIGLLYSAFTYYCGFKVNSGDYKFMGLAPYGEPIYADLIKDELINIKEDGSFHLNMDYFDFQNGRTMINENFEKLFGGKRRKPESRITKREMDIAASAQKVVEEILLKIVSYSKKKYGSDIDSLVMAGGVALNCVANGKILNSHNYKNLWIQPAAGDAGGALGCALYASYEIGHLNRVVNCHDSQQGSYLGNEYSNDEIREWLEQEKYPYRNFQYSDLFVELAKKLDEGKVIGLFHGRMEYGPRALGNRSIIADPRKLDMQVKLNLKIKYRESFRPFAPSVLFEDVSDYFNLNTESPYMLIVEDVIEKRQLKQDSMSKLKESGYDMLEVVKQKRSDIPAITHVDYSARIQSVTKERNPYYYQLIKEFKKLTGCSVVVNTSFNVRGEPIVCSLEDAYNCFLQTDMDVLVLENCVLYKDEQPNIKKNRNWIKKFELD